MGRGGPARYEIRATGTLTAGSLSELTVGGCHDGDPVAPAWELERSAGGKAAVTNGPGGPEGTSATTITTTKESAE